MLLAMLLTNLEFAALSPPETVLEVREKRDGFGELFQSFGKNFLSNLAEGSDKVDWTIAEG